jgi:hypothetical protein
MDKQIKTVDDNGIVKKNHKEVTVFVAQQICACSTNSDCCSAPGQNEKEINALTEAIRSEDLGRVTIKDIRDITATDKFPGVVKLVKQYGYSALPIVLVGNKVIVYGIPDKEFIISAIKRSGGNQKNK